MSIQPSGAAGAKGTVGIFGDFQKGLKDLDGFSHVILIYHIHQSHGFNLEVVPFWDSGPHGVFATRTPKRPNSIGLSIVKLCKVKNGTFFLQNVNILDGTSLLDIVPYVPEFDVPTEIQTGWIHKVMGNLLRQKSDNRFK